MACPTRLDWRRLVKLKSTRQETDEIRALTFGDEISSKAKPGQYVMVWVKGVDEVPLSLSRIGPRDNCGVLVERVGEATEAIHRLKVGQVFGLRGPYGNHFILNKGHTLLVAGGIGLAPLLPLATALVANGAEVDMACGARTGRAFCGLAEVRRTLPEKRLHIATDDGSLGAKGFVTTLLPPMLKNDYDMVYCCGPEPMMKEVLLLTEERGLPLQASMERIVKCSLGICGSCMIGGYRVCKDGLILASEQLRQVADEFGVYTRDLDGRRVRF